MRGAVDKKYRSSELNLLSVIKLRALFLLRICYLYIRSNEQWGPIAEMSYYIEIHKEITKTLRFRFLYAKISHTNSGSGFNRSSNRTNRNRKIIFKTFLHKNNVFGCLKVHSKKICF